MEEIECAVECNKAAVSNVEAVEQVLGRYYYEFEPVIEPDVYGNYSLSFLLNDGPEAVLRERYPSLEFDLLPEHRSRRCHRKILKAMEEHGVDDFHDLLKGLAPHLEDWLIIRMRLTLRDTCTTYEWEVMPRTSKIRASLMWKRPGKMTRSTDII